MLLTTNYSLLIKKCSSFKLLTFTIEQQRERIRSLLFYLILFICFSYMLHSGSCLYSLTASLGTYIIVVSPIIKSSIAGGVVAKHVMLVRLLQPSNAPSPMLVTLLPIVMLVRLLQIANAPYPTLVTLLGIVMLVRLLQPPNATSPMLVTLFGIVMLVRLLQPANALNSMLFTLSGIVMLVRLLQP